MAQVLLVILLLLASTYSVTTSYHDRRVYYSQEDNVCRGGSSDKVALTILFDDRQTVQKTINAGTVCNEYSLKYYNKISPYNYAIYEEFYNQPEFHYDQLFLKQNYTAHRLLDVVTSITMKSTIRNPAKFDNNLYDCVIDGDQTVHHYGPVGTIPAPPIKIYCQRIKTSIQTETS